MKKLCYYAVAATMFLAACNESLNEATEVEKDSNESNVEQISNKSHWGNKIEDPYTVDHMRLAFKELMKKNNSLSKAGVSVEQIEPTHLHLKFIPKNEEEYDLLEKDTILNVVPIPFDYDLEGFDGIYRDPECPEGQPTYQYAVVRLNHKLPNVEYIVLDSLFMPFEDDYDQETISKKAGFKRIWDDLELESIKLTGNFNDEDYIPPSLSKRYYPNGKVEYTDDYIGKVGVPNAKIHVNFSTHSHNGYTNSDGTFKINGRFSYKVHFHVYFKNNDCAIYNGLRAYEQYEAASYSGGRMITCNNFHIDESLDKKAAATMHMAGYNYVNNLLNIKQRLDNGPIKLCMDYNNSNPSMHFWYRNSGNIVDLVNIIRDRRREFGAAINAITGLMLECYSKDHYISNYDTLLQENWRACVEQAITAKYYKNYTSSSFEAYNKTTRGLFIELMNRGYSLYTLESNMKKIAKLEDKKQWDSFKESLKNGRSNSERATLDNLFNYWRKK